MNATAILKILDSVLMLLDVGSTAYLKLQESRARLRTIMAENREPTESEWAAVFDDIEANHETIQNS